MKRASILALAALATLATGSAQAQLARNGNGPLGINSDAFNYDPTVCQSTWKGRVEAVQEQSRLRADQVDVFGHKNGPKTCGGDFERMEANGNVFYVTPELKARGDKAVYTVSNDTITITGKVVVSSDQGVTETNRLTLNVNTGEARMGDAAPGQRVRAVIYPSKKPAAQTK